MKSSNVINLKDRLKEREKAAEPKPTPAQKMLSNDDIFEDVRYEIEGLWEMAAKNNELERFFYMRLPDSIANTTTEDAIFDLRQLSKIERLLKMQSAVYSPGAMCYSGYISSFTIDKETYFTRENLESETVARAMNIILYLEYKKVHKFVRS